MRFTIIPEDQTIVVDGEAISPLDIALDPAIRVVQGYDTYVEIEYNDVFDATLGRPVKPSNSFSQDFTPYAPLLEAWAAEKQRRDASATSQA